jgi:transcriptional regulator with PAS, ATPase and Fis domain
VSSSFQKSNDGGGGDQVANAGLDVLLSYLENEAQPMIVLDPAYNILAANTAYRRQFTVYDQPYIGQKCYHVSHHYDVPCDQAGEHCPMKKALEVRGPDRVLHIHHTPRGQEHVDVELRPLFDAGRRIVAYVERLVTVRSASAQPSSEGLVGHSAAFNQALGELQRVAPSPLPVLLLGESGTGKELFARAIHEASPRARKPFVVVDCSGFSETLFESELFGYEKGAFTGAQNRKPGLVETASGGTLFLDEIGDVPLAMQVKLLRLIETGAFRRVGSVENQRSDFRLVAATHKPLREMVARGQFRQDLFYRLSVFPVRLPPLRERIGDIEVLAHSILRRGDAGGAPWSIEADALQLLCAHHWPGNIRELRNVLERARLFADDHIVRAQHFPPDLFGTPMPGAEDGTADGSGAGRPAAAASRHPARGYTDEELSAEMHAFRGSRRALAARLGMSERTLYRRLRALGPALR